MPTYQTYALIPKSIIDRLPVTDTNTEAERALILRVVNATLTAGVYTAEVQRIRAQQEAMEAWQNDIGNAPARYATTAGLLTRIAVAVEKMARMSNDEDVK